MKKTILTAVFVCMMFIPVYAEFDDMPDDIMDAAIPPVEIVDFTNNSKTKPAAITKDKIGYKQPLSKRKMAKKFLLAMFGVAISSLILFVILILYNKFCSRVTKALSDNYSNTLNTPKNLKDAVNIFLEKSKY